ncbi:hypothetical protein F4802DRAFT_601661 [Xylaria palmicola]|nr:hypothetical protein F4802DRAFT_601661 [Xylaria palmicola]
MEPHAILLRLMNNKSCTPMDEYHRNSFLYDSCRGPATGRPSGRTARTSGDARAADTLSEINLGQLCLENSADGGLSIIGCATPMLGLVAAAHEWDADIRSSSASTPFDGPTATRAHACTNVRPGSLPFLRGWICGDPARPLRRRRARSLQRLISVVYLPPGGGSARATLRPAHLLSRQYDDAFTSGSIRPRRAQPPGSRWRAGRQTLSVQAEE